MSEQVQVDEANQWRMETPGTADWPRTARPDDPNKYLMVSADTHTNEPADLWATRIEAKYKDRIPHQRVDANGDRWSVVEGYRPTKIRIAAMTGQDQERNSAGDTVEGRARDHKRDGIDAEIIFPNKGLAMWATPDPELAMAQCRIWNDWAWETFGPHNDTMSPMACLATGDIPGTMAEIERTANMGFRGLTMPCKPIFGSHDVDDPNYNLPMFDPMWALIEETGLPITFHISTGRDPRASKGMGGAVINYVSHSLSPTIEPLANMCASGVLERFPKLQFALIECGIGWVPWALEAMDEAYRKHHFWVRPKLQGLPSDYYKAHGAAAFQEDPVGLALIEQFGLEKNCLWANDYPHHEGTWPHSAEAIERTMSGISDDTRAKILGLNANKMFNFNLPEAPNKTANEAAH
ncbi:MAG: amidohydrolase [Rhodospirillaceae bacterium]|jgi:predicted TIM-barrel fold metal-dependent hydrolase|nr:amidohydrolase [Rhodospirillaceae bacterium]MBT4689810.1 amidohydrolase [Rhodospirillaceae bacterium]MBT5083051.1 amidohydrolase [Rhodospirillaceae bacterium]MBT5524495.1 amidohydrolase [Rhodospirillaceae bacterium]MBT5881683.1 amidohydrolase [Rhodospirillaceae bacterium]